MVVVIDCDVEVLNA